MKKTTTCLFQGRLSVAAPSNELLFPFDVAKVRRNNRFDYLGCFVDFHFRIVFTKACRL